MEKTYYLSITGSYATGSSAVIDLLKGHPSFGVSPDCSYEHVLLYNPNCIFDLEWKLLYNNDIHRSDEAIKSFRKEFERLNYNYGWFGSYRNLFGDKLDVLVDQYINSLIDYKHHLISYKDYKKVRFSLIKLVLQLGAHILQKRKIYKYGRQYVYYPDSSTQYAAHPTEERFCEETKKFIKGYAELFATNKVNIFDHLILPNHTNRIDKFFDDSFRFIVVNRDPRDLFILSKYIYKSKNPFPDNVEDFCSYYLSVRECVTPNKKLLEVSFEDLVYYPKETKDKILGFCNADKIDYQSDFDPNKSINNTQVFLLNEKWKDEVAVIEERLNKYLYNFPYKRIPSTKDIFE